MSLFIFFLSYKAFGRHLVFSFLTYSYPQSDFSLDIK